jgi:PAS domain S-box-containing protein
MSAPFGFAYHQIILDDNENPVDYEFLEVNRAFENLTGLKSQNIINKLVSEVIPGIKESAFDWISFYGKIAVNGGEELFEQYFEQFDKWYRVQVHSPDKYYFATTFTEITNEINQIKELKIIGNKLRKSEEIHRLLADNSSDVILTLDLDERLTYISPSIYKLSGYKPDEFLNKFLSDLFTSNSNDIFARTIKNLKNSVDNSLPIPEMILELEVICQNSEILWTEATISGIFKATGEFVGILVLMRNITERKRNEAALQDYYSQLEVLNEELGYSKEIIESTLFEKNELVELLEESKISLENTLKEKDKFFSIIAHDLKSPFTGFIGISQELAEHHEHLTNKEIQEFAVMLKTSAEDLYKLLENLLEWSRIQRGMIDFNPENINVYFIIQNILGFQNSNAVQKNIELRNLIPQELNVLGDLNMVNTIFRNLISNSLKFTNSGGYIEIGILNSKINLNSENLEEITFYVKDSGIGIPPKMIPSMFIIGEKNSRKGTAGESSTGLGLILCKEYIDKHNGNIWIFSEEGVGTTFYFNFRAE